MPKPRYSIVVPTRHRPHTLPHALATIIAQDHDSFEIVVADNASGPETRRVVEELADHRIVYLRSDVSLSMSANWQRALTACRGEWITFIGDDDGLMPGALTECDALIATHSVRSIRQQYAVYVWPCAGATGEANRLQLHLGRRVRVEEARQSLTEMMARPNLALMPLPYHGWIHRSLYDQAAKSGPVFQGMDPDTYAGVLLAALTDQFVSQDRPLSAIGISGTSNTYRFVITGLPGESTRDSVALHASEGIVRHSMVPDIPSVTAALIDGLLQIRARLGEDALPYRPSPLEIALHCAASVWRTDAEGRSQWQRCRDKLATASDRETFDAAVEAAKPSGQPPRMVCIDRGRNGPYVVLDTRSLGVSTIAGAATAAAAALEATWQTGIDAYAPASPIPPPRLLKRLERRLKGTVRGWWGDSKSSDRQA